MLFRRSLNMIVALAISSTAVNPQMAGVDPSRPQVGRLIPEPMPEGMSAQGRPTFYTPDNLYTYMDGGADAFVLYGVQEMLHMDVRAKAVDVVVDVFDMGTADSAFGMYASERSADYQFLSIGAEGYRNTGILNFFQDRYYVKLAGFGDGADAVLEALARTISARIGSSPVSPSLLSLLPAENRKAHSEQYFPNDPFGHLFLGPAYVATYSRGEQESRLLVTIAFSETDAHLRLNQLMEHFTKTGTCAAAPEVGKDAIRATNSFEGSILATTKSHYLVLLMNPAADGAQLLENALKRLQ